MCELVIDLRNVIWSLFFLPSFCISTNLWRLIACCSFYFFFRPQWQFSLAYDLLKHWNFELKLCFTQRVTFALFRSWSSALNALAWWAITAGSCCHFFSKLIKRGHCLIKMLHSDFLAYIKLCFWVTFEDWLSLFVVSYQRSCVHCLWQVFYADVLILSIRVSSEVLF